MNLQKKLGEWQRHKLITAKQAKAIGEFEAQTRKPVLSYLIWGLSALFIGIGIISLITANWHTIPPEVKLTADFTSLIFCGWAVFYSRDWPKQYLNEAFLLLYALLILATIGLTAQIYQLQTDDSFAFFVWSVLCIPLLPLSHYRALAWIWLPVFIFSGLDLLNNFSWYHHWQSFISGDFPTGEYLFILQILALTYALTVARENSVPLCSALRDWLIIGGAAMVLYLDFFQGYYNVSQSGIFSASAGLLLLLTAALVLINFRRSLPQLDAWILALLTFFSWGYGFTERYSLTNELMGFVLTLIALSILLGYAYRFCRPKLMHFTAGMIALRVFGGYLQVFGSLTATGFGLIFSGLVFLSLTIICKRITSLFPSYQKEKCHD